MTSYNIRNIFTCFARHQNSICVKLGIVSFICLTLCSTCFLVERCRHNAAMKGKQNARRNTEKLIQVKFNDIYEESTQARPYKELSGEKSGYYIDTTELWVGKNAKEESILDSTGLYKEKAFQLHESNQIHTSEPFMSQTNLENIFENLPKFKGSKSELPTASSESKEHATLIDTEERHSLENLESTPSELLITIRRMSAEKRNSNSKEDLFSEEYELNVDSMPVQDTQKAYHSLDYGDNNYNHQETEATYVPTFFESLFGKMSNLFTPISQTNSLNSQLPLSHWGGLDDKLYKNENFALEESIYKPVWKPLNKEYFGNTRGNYEKATPSPLDNWLNAMKNNSYTNTLKMFENIFQGKPL